MNNNNNALSGTKVLTIIVQIILCVMFAIVIVGLIQQYLFSPIQIAGASMMPTIKESGDKVYIVKTGYKLEYYDMIIFFRPNNPDVDENDNPANKKVSLTEFLDNLPIIGKNHVTDDSETGDFTCVIKRIIGLPGDTITIEDGKLFRKAAGDSETERINDFIMDAEYFKDTAEPVTMGEDEYFVLGDNRNNSFDSEDYGPINESWIYGKVVLISSDGKIKVPEK
jgi:signal peptidase I